MEHGFWNGVVNFGSYIKNTIKNSLKKDGKIDNHLLLITLFMTVFGLVMLYSAGYHESVLNGQSRTASVIGQAKYGILGILCMVFAARLHYTTYRNPLVVWGIYLMSIVMVLLTKFTSLGVEANGAKRWLNLGFSIQISEIVKIAAILSTAALINMWYKRMDEYLFIIAVLSPLAVLTGAVLLLTKDLSSAIIIFAIGFVMVFTVTKRKMFMGLIFALCGGVGVAAIMSETYRRKRMISWWLSVRQGVTGDYAKTDEGYQTLQGLRAIASGGWFGKGLGNGTQKLGHVPEAQNDMIFTIICEELGIIGAVAVIIMFIYLIWTMMDIMRNIKQLYGALLVMGVATHITVQTIINLAVVTNLFPNTGVTLPFFSEGGSSLITMLMEIGIVLSVSRSIPMPERKSRPRNRNGGNHR